MQSHIAGPITGSRNAAIMAVHSFSVNPVDFLTGVAKKLLAFDYADLLNPVAMEVSLIILTPSDAATSAAITIQLTGNVSPADIIAAADLKAAKGTLVETSPRILLTDLTGQALRATCTYVGIPTVGNAYIIVKCYQLSNRPLENPYN